MDPVLNSRERVLMALNHKEPDRVPLDIGGVSQTGLHANAYKNLIEYLHIDKPVRVFDWFQQLASIDEEVLQGFEVDTRGLSPAMFSQTDERQHEEDDGYVHFTDRWGIRYAKPRVGGYYFDMIGHPLGGEITRREIDAFKLPDPTEMGGDMKPIAQAWENRSNPPAIVLEATEGGMLEFGFWLRGFENFYVDMGSDPGLACYLLDKILDFKIAVWETALSQVGSSIDVAWEVDDLGLQNGPMLSPAFYKEYIKPRHKKLFSFIKSRTPQRVFVGLHSCGSIRAFIPDLIDAGVDALNPIQVSAAHMDTRELKREFGRDITFWGGGVNTQSILPRGTPQDVRDEVRRRIGDLAPGGGFVFAAVHNIQADVPPQNIIAMVDALHEHGIYNHPKVASS